MKKLKKIIKVEGQIKVLTGLHIGAGDSEIKIGGIDNPVVKDKDGYPYIPGSSLKGKCRSLLEILFGFYRVEKNEDQQKYEGKVGDWDLLNDNNLDDDAKEKGRLILKLFGAPGLNKVPKKLFEEVFITRAKFNDAYLYKEDRKKDFSQIYESKFENFIDRIKGNAQHPRQTERVAKGNRFDFSITLKIFDGDNEEELLKTLLLGLKLVEEMGLGGNVSRGYGLVEFNNLKIKEIFNIDQNGPKDWASKFLEKRKLKDIEEYKI